MEGSVTCVSVYTFFGHSVGLYGEKIGFYGEKNTPKNLGIDFYNNNLVMLARMLMKIIAKNITHKSNLFFCNSNATIKKMPSMVFTLKCNVAIFRSQFLLLGQFLESKIQRTFSIVLELQTLTAVIHVSEK